MQRSQRRRVKKRCSTFVPSAAHRGQRVCAQGGWASQGQTTGGCPHGQHQGEAAERRPPSETQESQIDATWNEPVTTEALTKAWMGFVEKLRKEDRIALTATMSLGDPELRGMQVVYGVNNPLQREQMDGLRTEVLVHLKTTLKNASLELHLEMKEQAMEEKKAFLSDKDRYDMMVEKNPALDKLRKALDLDLG